MKKYFFSLLALVLAVGVTSFTVMDELVTVVYNEVDPSDPDQVSNPSNWEVQENPPVCPDDEELPCTIRLDASYTQSGKLRSDIEITLQQTAAHYVPLSLKQGSTPISATITNKAEE